MFRTSTRYFTLLSLLATSGSLFACMEHYGFGAYEMGGNQSYYRYYNRLAEFKKRSAEQSKVTVSHPAMTVAEVNEEQQLNLRYQLPESSENLRVQLSATADLKMFDESISLTGHAGSLDIRYLALKSGLNTITITFMGDEDGRTLTHTSTVYVRSKATS